LLLACTEDEVTRRPPSSQAGTGGGAVGGSGNDALDGGREPDASSIDPLDASPDAADAADANASGVVCCEPSPEPDCCMDYGGHRLAGSSVCGNTACDGMAPPDANWQLGTDEYGCAVWIEPEDVVDCCGCPADGGL
jgi:hypothetical protein